MATITIKRDPTGNLVFDPNPITLGPNDFVIWVNEDPLADHQPTVVPKPNEKVVANYWMEYRLPKFVGGQPAATSPTINLKGPPDVIYQDGLDTSPNAVKGTIKFQA